VSRGARSAPAFVPLLLAALLVTGAGAAAGATIERPDEQLRGLLREAIARADSFDDRFDAEVWLTDMAGRLGDTVPDAEERVDILRHVHREARRADLEPELVLAVIQVESNFDRFAISSAGARGLMQIMPFWLDEIGRPNDNLFKIPTNLRFGCTILRYYLDKERGDLARALARYNGSLGKFWYPRRVMRAWRMRWFPQ
jgi:soluble lytic murein transglycosylase-like protein